MTGTVLFHCLRHDKDTDSDLYHCDFSLLLIEFVGCSKDLVVNRANDDHRGFTVSLICRSTLLISDNNSRHRPTRSAISDGDSCD